MNLRPYQRDAVDSLYEVWDNGKMKNPLIVAPTGAGKSPILGTLASEVTQHPDSRVVVLTHRAELIKQDKAAIEAFTSVPVGIWSAQLKRKDKGKRILVAGIASIYKKACDFDPFDVAIIDECHLLGRGDSTMYQRFLRDAWLVNPKMKLVGLSATPYRLDSGYLHEGSDALFDGISYEIGVKYLIDNGYLSPVISKGGVSSIDLSGVHKRGGEFIASELAAAADTSSLVDMATDEICRYGANRRSWLLFCAGVDHAQHVADAINRKGFVCEVVSGDTTQAERERIYAGMRDGSIRAIANCQVLTTGFDLPQIDLVALLTATESTGLYVQMVGRGTRTAEGKDNCLLLDYGGNVVRHGVFDDVQPKFSGENRGDGQAPAKVCPSCMEVVHAAVSQCHNCDHEFPPPEVVHEVVAYDGAVLKEQVKDEEIEVMSVSYHRHRKEGKPPSVRVDYHCGWLIKHSEWLCPEHTGYPRRSFENRCVGEWKINPLSDCEELLRYAESLPKPKKIRVRQQPGKKFSEIVARTY
jgi:DNA repair protein RadD